MNLLQEFARDVICMKSEFKLTGKMLVGQLAIGLQSYLEVTSGLLGRMQMQVLLV